MRNRITAFLLLFSFVLSACGNNPQLVTPSPSRTVVPSPVPSPSPSPTPSPTPTPEDPPVFLTTTVWEQEPRVPILLYHLFVPDEYTGPGNTMVRLGDFRAQLESLYNAGYSLIQVEDWLNGRMIVPPGRRPLAITVDDLFRPNQLELDEAGNPSPETGVGVLWQFSQKHPDFGFQVMLFSNLGDKTYGVESLEERKLKQARAVVWCMEHGARIYNHTFSHLDLLYATPEQFAADLAMNDTYLREILALVGRQDLIPQLGNMLAVPYSWPPLSNQAMYDVMENYTTPEGKPMQAVFGSAYFASASPMPPPYTPGFDPYNIKRFEVNPDALNYLVRDADKFPTAQECTLGPLAADRIGDPGYLSEQIGLAVGSSACPAGIHVIEGMIFDARIATTTYLFP